MSAIVHRTASKPLKKKQKTAAFDPEKFLATVEGGRTIKPYAKGAPIFKQGDAADAVFFLIKGRVKVAVTSTTGKEAIVSILNAGEFFGEGCLIGQELRLATATAMDASSVTRLPKPTMVRMLQSERKFADMFTTHLLTRNSRAEEDLVDQLFNSSEKRLARILLLLANFGKNGKTEQAIANVSQETLAEMVGTTRPRVSFFMNKFRKLGFIEYNGDLRVHSSLLSVVLRD
jgi:CRP/FNR family transcriptional regulator, cyclic AMP receptor protein